MVTGESKNKSSSDYVEVLGRSRPLKSVCCGKSPFCFALTIGDFGVLISLLSYLLATVNYVTESSTSLPALLVLHSSSIPVTLHSINIPVSFQNL